MHAHVHTHKQTHAQLCANEPEEHPGGLGIAVLSVGISVGFAAPAYIGASVGERRL
jgi:hypothetical protein